MSSARVHLDRPAPLAQPSTRVVARWRVSRAALDRAMPGVVASGKANQHAVLEIVIEGSPETGDWSATAALLDPRLKTSHRLDPHLVHRVGPIRLTREGDHTHIEAPGLLSATFRGDSRAPVFARTPLLAAIGVPGGRYELDSASID